MIIGVGIDVVNASRMTAWGKIPGIFERYFHPEELCDARTKGKSVILSLAARFAAKEALGKAVGTGMRNIRLRDIRIINDEYGKPIMEVYDTALSAIRRVGGERIHVSLTHEKDTAIAVVIIEGA